MHDQDMKLRNFERIVLQEVMESSNALLEQAEIKRERRVKSEELKILEATHKYIQREIDKITKEKRARTLKLSVQHKQRLLNLRENCVRSILENVRARLIEFTKTNEYETFLIDKVHLAVKELDSDQCEVSMRQDDQRFAHNFQDMGFEVQYTDEIEVGGVIAMCSRKGILLDYTLDKMLEHEYQNFLDNNSLDFLKQD